MSTLDAFFGTFESVRDDLVTIDFGFSSEDVNSMSSISNECLFARVGSLIDDCLNSTSTNESKDGLWCLTVNDIDSLDLEFVLLSFINTCIYYSRVDASRGQLSRLLAVIDAQANEHRILLQPIKSNQPTAQPVHQILSTMFNQYQTLSSLGKLSVSQRSSLFVISLLSGQSQQAAHLLNNSTLELFYDVSKLASGNESESKISEMYLLALQIVTMISFLELAAHDLATANDDFDGVNALVGCEYLQAVFLQNAQILLTNNRIAVPLASYSIRCFLLHLGLEHRPDLAYIILQDSYKVNWLQYLSSMSCMTQENWRSLIYARKHSQVDLWQSIDADWDDEGYAFVSLMSREEVMLFLKDKPVGSFLLVPQPVESNANTSNDNNSQKASKVSQFLLSYRVESAEGIKNAILRRDCDQQVSDDTTDANDTNKPRYSYRCGKFGPHHSLIETLRGISGIISGSLCFDPMLPPALPLPGTGLFAPKLDLNAQLWHDLSHVMPRWINTIGMDLLAAGGQGNRRRKGAASDVPEVSYDDDDDEDRHSGDTAYSDEMFSPRDRVLSRSTRASTMATLDPKSPSQRQQSSENAHREDNFVEWRGFDPSFIVNVNRKVTAALVWKRFAKQNIPMLLMLHQLHEIDDRTSSSSSTESEANDDFDVIKTMLQCQQQVGQVQEQVHANDYLTHYIGPFEELKFILSSSPFATCLWMPLIHNIHNLEVAILGMVKPPVPMDTWLQSTLQTLPSYENVSSAFINNAKQNEDMKEMMLAERLVQHLLDILPVKTLRMTESTLGHGLTDCLLYDCLAAVDIMHVINKWRDMLLTSSTRSIMKLPTQSKRGANEDDDEDYYSDFSKGDKVAAQAMEDALKKDLQYSRLDWIGAKILQSILRLLHLDLFRLEGMELVHRVVTWLHQRRIIREVVKPPETAFSIPQVYYHYIDPWECKSEAVGRDADYSFYILQLGRQCLRSTLHHEQEEEDASSSYNWRKNGLLVLDDEAVALEFTQPYTKRLAMVLRCHAITSQESFAIAATATAKTSYTKRSSQFGPESSVARRERQQDHDYHFLQLVEFLRTEEYLKQLINAPLPVDSSSRIVQQAESSMDKFNMTMLQQDQLGLWHASADAQCNIIRSLDASLYRNALFSRLLMPQRYTAAITVDIYCLKEILSIAPGHGHGHVPSGKSSGSISPSPISSVPISSTDALIKSFSASNLGAMFNHHHPASKPVGNTIMSSQQVVGANMGHSIAATTVTITPSSSLHGHQVEVYAVIRLVRTSVENRNNNDSSNTNLFGGGKVHVEGSFVTNAHRAEPAKMGGNSSGGSSGNGQGGNPKPLQTSPRPAAPAQGQAPPVASRRQAGGKFSKQLLQQVGSAVDYDWRTQAQFRFTLPVGWLTLLQREFDSDRHDIRCAPPLKIVITVYERTMFFADNKMGEVEISLQDLSEKQSVKDWFPLIQQDRSVSWLLFAQAKLKMQMMLAEEVPTEANTDPVSTKEKSAGNTSSPQVQQQQQLQQAGAGGGIAAAGVKLQSFGKMLNQKKTNFLSHLDDFF